MKRHPTPTQAMLDTIELCARRALDDAPAAREALAWYDSARAWCAALAETYDLTTEAVAGAVAALSPQVSWRKQLEWVPRVLAWFQRDSSADRVDGAGVHASDCPGPGFIGSKRKALAILSGASPSSVLSGPKVRAFYRAIMGAPDAVVIDRHAFALAYAGDPPRALTARRYELCARAYRMVAVALGIEPARLQALCWAWWKDHRAPSAGTERR